jgi:uncharacterized membrane protein
VEKSRIEAFRDGVFAIAITLLVLEIEVPSQADAANDGLWVALVLAWPSFFAFLASFVAIPVVWVHHHGIFLASPSSPGSDSGANSSQTY